MKLNKLMPALGTKTAQHSTAQHSTAQHSTAQHSTAQHNFTKYKKQYFSYFLKKIKIPSFFSFTKTMGAKTLTKGALISLCFITISFLISNESLAKKVKPLPQIIGINSPLRIPDSYIITYKESAIQARYEQLNQKKSSKQVKITDVNVNFSQSIATSSASQLTAIYGNSINGAALINSNQSTIQDLYNDSRIDKIYANLSINQNAYDDSPQPQAPWGLDRIDQVNYPLDAKYHFSNTAQAVHVFVLDSGIDESHPEFNGRLIDEHEFIETPCITDICAIRYELNGATDNNGHGTHVAGIIAGKTYGVAKDVILHSYKMFDVNGGSSLALLIDAFDTLYNDISSHNLYPAIVNMSFGARFTTGTLNDPNQYEPYIDALLNLKNNLGVHLVAAAGNANTESCDQPAAHSAVISVGATRMVNNTDQRASFSNYGSCVDIYAPGTSIVSALKNTNSHTSMSGTSHAAPFVTGALALYLQEPLHRNETPNQARATLLATANSVNLPNTTFGPHKLLNTTALSPLPNQPDDYDNISIRGYTDDYEGDAESIIANGAIQTHNFHDAGDQDWTMVWASAPINLIFSTQSIGSNSSTKTYIYKVTSAIVNPNYPGTNRFIIQSKQLVASDTNGGNSSVPFTTEANFLYIMKTVSATNAYGSNTEYTSQLDFQ